tara:strand:- start:840 stop:1004 length:165 start_codon:yes stop_codon:yes gene_type:complete
MDFIIWILIIVAVASVVVAVTPTPKDNKWLKKGYKCIEVLALNVWKAKDKQCLR